MKRLSELSKKTISLKTFILTILCITILSTSIIVLASNSNTFTISEGVYPSAPTYTIWREDSTYYAKNAYGVIQYSGTQAYQVIENAIQQCPNGGIVHLKEATYNLDTSGETQPYDGVTLNKSIIFEGEGNGTILKYSGDFKYSIIQVKGVTGVIIRDLQIDGDKDTSGRYGCTGIAIGSDIENEQADNTVINNVYIHDTAWVGIYVRLYCDYTQITNSIIKDISNSTTSDPAIRITHLASDTLIQGNAIINAYEHAIRTYISETTRSKRTRIIGNTITGYTALGSLQVQGEGDVIQGNTLQNTGSTTAGGGICAEKTRGTTIQGNTLKNINDEGIHANNCSGISIFGNTIENSTSNGIILKGGTTNSSLTGNTIYDCGSTSQAGIYLTGSASGGNTTNIAVVGNIITNCYYGTYEPEYADYNLIVGNIIRDTTSTAIKQGTGVGNNDEVDHNLT